jgi:uncharacterized membrane protein YkvA (DUF1232 family)
MKRDSLTLYYAWRDPRTPLIARVLAAGVAAYALSPIDLIPDFIPVLGFLDDLIIVPLGVAAVVKMLPTEVVAEARVKADATASRPISRTGAVVIIGIWMVVLAIVLAYLARIFTGS